MVQGIKSLIEIGFYSNSLNYTVLSTLHLYNGHSLDVQTQTEDCKFRDRKQIHRKRIKER